jgi:hypothetical protein
LKIQQNQVPAAGVTCGRGQRVFRRVIAAALQPGEQREIRTKDQAGGKRSARGVQCCSKSSSFGEIQSAQPNLFDCAKGRPFSEGIAQDPLMFGAITAFLIVLSVGILIAHALDAFRHWT